VLTNAFPINRLAIIFKTGPYLSLRKPTLLSGKITLPGTCSGYFRHYHLATGGKPVAGASIVIKGH